MNVEEKPSLADLRRAFQETAGRPAAPCPTPETIWDAVHGALPAAEIRPVVEHLAACPACALEWRLARELGGPAGEEAPAAAGISRRQPRWRRFLPVAAAAGLVLAAAAGLLRFSPHGPAPDRGQPGVAAARLAPAATTLLRTNPVLRWAPGVPGASYDVNVTTADGAPVGRAEDLTEPRYRLPAASLAPLPARTRLLATLTVHGPDGSVSARTDAIILD